MVKRVRTRAVSVSGDKNVEEKGVSGVDRIGIIGPNRLCEQRC